jgi:hypothetical protein
MDDFVTKAHCLQLREKDILKLQENTQRLNDHDRRLDAVENMTGELKEMNKTLTAMLEKMDHHKEKLDEQSERLSALEQVPKMRWNAVVQAIISVVIGSVLTLGIQNILVR